MNIRKQIILKVSSAISGVKLLTAQHDQPWQYMINMTLPWQCLINSQTKYLIFLIQTDKCTTYIY